MIVILFSICILSDLSRVFSKALMAGSSIQSSRRDFWSSDRHRVPLCSSMCFIAYTLHRHLLYILAHWDLALCSGSLRKSTFTCPEPKQPMLIRKLMDGTLGQMPYAYHIAPSYGALGQQISARNSCDTGKTCHGTDSQQLLNKGGFWVTCVGTSPS